MIQVILADDHPAFRIGIRILLEQAPDVSVVAEAGDGYDALALVAKLRPDVVVLDCHLPGMSGPQVAATIKENALQTRVLALSAHDDSDYIRAMLEAGAVGYLLKSEAPRVIVDAVRAVDQESWFSSSVMTRLVAMLRGRSSESLDWPTARETDVLHGLAQGWTNAQIAQSLDITARTVAYHIENLLGKLGANNRTEAVVEAIRRGWIEI